jgi:hypothetical protein
VRGSWLRVVCICHDIVESLLYTSNANSIYATEADDHFHQTAVRNAISVGAA